MCGLYENTFHQLSDEAYTAEGNGKVNPFWLLGKEATCKRDQHRNKRWRWAKRSSCLQGLTLGPSQEQIKFIFPGFGLSTVSLNSLQGKQDRCQIQYRLKFGIKKKGRDEQKLLQFFNFSKKIHPLPVFRKLYSIYVYSSANVVWMTYSNCCLRTDSKSKWKSVEELQFRSTDFDTAPWAIREKLKEWNHFENMILVLHSVTTSLTLAI